MKMNFDILPLPLHSHYCQNPEDLLHPVLSRVVCCSDQYPLEVKQQGHKLSPGHMTSTDLFPSPVQPVPVGLYQVYWFLIVWVFPDVVTAICYSNVVPLKCFDNFIHISINSYVVLF